MKLRPVIAFVYNSSQDPLFKGNLLLLLEHVARQQADLRLHLITYEQPEYALSAEAEARQRAAWAAEGIEWHALRYHSGGRLLLFKKAYDLTVGLLLCLRLRLAGSRGILGLGTVAGSFAFFIAKLLGMKYYGYQFEPHSEFMRDCRIWSAGSLAYRGLHLMEQRTAQGADLLSTGTQHMLARLAAEHSPARAYLLPSCVDENRFQFTAAGRAAVRARYGLPTETPVLLYLGKFGGIYYDDEIGQFFAALLAQHPDWHLLVATPDPPGRVRAGLLRAGLPEASFTLTRSPYEEVPAYISAADFGLVAVPPLPSQRFRSPIKVGEYLCCGLPYLTCRGVSDDDRVAEEYGVGVVVSEYSTAEAVRVAPLIAGFLAEAREPLRARCRRAGVAYRGLSQYLPVANEIFAQL
ncbi:MAG: hypothetical protein EOO37_00250 [Cytophagaceae bacterium]|nr:MAG: hypothetical protein EOO37_00250 [Cytophagaceae bacterium]